MILYINLIHLTLSAFIAYGLFIFVRQYIRGENKFTFSLILVMSALLLSELWSLATLLQLLTDSGRIVTRAFQITLYQASFLHLAYTSIILRRESELKVKEPIDEEQTINEPD